MQPEGFNRPNLIDVSQKGIAKGPLARVAAERASGNLVGWRLALALALMLGLAPLPAHAGPPRCFQKPATIVGTRGSDRLRGTPHRDVIVGLGGPDFIRAGPGDDVVCGGAGSDHLVGGLGRDAMDASIGADALWGKKGKDVLIGGGGPDEPLGGQDNDTLSAGAGEDDLEGGPDNDRLLGEEGMDTLAGELGNDRMQGGSGEDLAFFFRSRGGVTVDLGGGTAVGKAATPSSRWRMSSGPSSTTSWLAARPIT